MYREQEQVRHRRGRIQTLVKGCGLAGSMSSHVARSIVTVGHLDGAALLTSAVAAGLFSARAMESGTRFLVAGWGRDVWGPFLEPLFPIDPGLV